MKIYFTLYKSRVKTDCKILSELAVCLHGLIELGQAGVEVVQLRFLQVRDVVIVCHVLVNLADVVDRLFGVVLEGVLDLDKCRVRSVQLLDKELKRLFQSFFLLLLEVFLRSSSLHLRVTDSFKLFF